MKQLDRSGRVSLALLGVGLSLTALSVIGAVFAVLTMLGSVAIRPFAMKFLLDVASSSRNGVISMESPDPASAMALCVTRRWAAHHARVAVLSLTRIPTKETCQRRPRRRAYDMIAEGFGPGFNGPLLVALKTSDPGMCLRSGSHCLA